MKHPRMNNRALPALLAAIACIGLSQCSSHGPIAGANSAHSSCADISKEARRALTELCDRNPEARKLSASAEAVLVFPDIFKAGFVFGGMGGNGALIRRDGNIDSFYQTGGLTYGLEAGVQHYGYALFFMDDAALHKLSHTGGWEIGSSPNLVIVRQGMAASLSNLTVKKGIYATFFNQHGLMGGISVQGSKITRIHPRS